MVRPFDGRRERERDQGKGRQNGMGSLGHRFEGLAGGERSVSMWQALLTPSLGVDPVIDLVFRWGNQGWQS